jgi:hypothetical protein
VFGPEYLKAPNAQDTARILDINNARGFSRLAWLNLLHALEFLRASNAQDTARIYLGDQQSLWFARYNIWLNCLHALEVE